MIRSVKVKLYNSKIKQRKINALIQSYRKAVNFYLSFEDLKLNKETLAKLTKTNLSQRFKSNALKQAISIQKSCKKTKKKTPKFKGFPILDAKFINIEHGKNSFDLWIKLSTLAKGKRIYLPSKKHKRLNYWLEKGNLTQGCELHVDKLILWIEIEKSEYKTVGKDIGVDIGMTKLLTTSEGKFLGTKFKEINDKILRKKKNSKAYFRSLRERDNYVNQTVNLLDWENIKLLCYENLKNLVKGRKNRRSRKCFRVRQQHWTYSNILSRLRMKGQENRVRLVYVNPKNTSRTCPLCNNVDKANRNWEKFDCIACGYKQDADIVGSINILRKGCDWLRSLESLNNK